MGSHAGQQRTSFVRFESAGHHRCWEHTREAESAERHRMPRRELDGSEHFGHEVVCMVNKTADVSPIPGAVGPESDCRLLETPIENARPTSVEGMGDRDLGVDPIADIDRLEERRCNAERVDRSTDIMEESWERELLGAGATADGVGAFDHKDAASRSRQLDGRGESVRSGTHNNCVERSHPPSMAGFVDSGRAEACRWPRGRVEGPLRRADRRLPPPAPE